MLLAGGIWNAGIAGCGLTPAPQHHPVESYSESAVKFWLYLNLTSPSLYCNKLLSEILLMHEMLNLKNPLGIIFEMSLCYK